MEQTYSTCTLYVCEMQGTATTTTKMTTTRREGEQETNLHDRLKIFKVSHIPIFENVLSSLSSVFFFHFVGAFSPCEHVQFKVWAKETENKTRESLEKFKYFLATLRFLFSTKFCYWVLASLIVVFATVVPFQDIRKSAE